MMQPDTATIELCAKIADEEAAQTADGEGEIYIARKIAERIRDLIAGGSLEKRS